MRYLASWICQLPSILWIMTYSLSACLNGICSSALDWISSYLRGRRQAVMYDGGRSCVRKLSHGVPQGSVLGPLLFQTWVDLPRNLGSHLTYMRMTHSSTRQVRGPLIFSGGWSTALMSWRAG